MHTAIRLRSAHAADQATLIAISAEARGRYAAFPALAHLVSAPPVSAARFLGGEAVIACAGDDPTILGFALARPLDSCLFLDNISVRTAAAGKGVGGALLAHVVALAVSLGLPAVSLTTFRTPPWNGPWFRRHGFVPMPGEAIGDGLRAIIAQQFRYLDPVTREVLWRGTGDAPAA